MIVNIYEKVQLELRNPQNLTLGVHEKSLKIRLSPKRLEVD